ncbi:MAG TPA: hypothetical protein VJ725_08980 [Thermoanaerobaculia bacterium]|nr:hypothetical protein [Thermoanaerobaculia bacterium]
MYELHENEQYFFDEKTLDQLSGFLLRFSAPCCICAPLLGKRLAERGAAVTVLDIDERFAGVRGFRRWDLYRPEWLGQEFDVIVCDPPFFNASLSQLFAALRMLARNDFSQPMLVSYLKRRSEAILGTFAPFGLKPTGYLPSYQTVEAGERNEIEFFSNLPEEEIRWLSGDLK